MANTGSIISGAMGILTLKVVQGVMKSGLGSGKGSSGKIKTMKIKWK